jgi:hypothetical protein
LKPGAAMRLCYSWFYLIFHHNYGYSVEDTRRIFEEYRPELQRVLEAGGSFDIESVRRPALQYPQAGRRSVGRGAKKGGELTHGRPDTQNQQLDGEGHA